MNADEISDAWERHYGNCLPSTYLGLYQKSDIGRVRFHFLPDTGWYEGKVRDTHCVLRRMTAVCGQALGEGPCIAIREDRRQFGPPHPFFPVHPFPDLVEHPLPRLSRLHLFQPKEETQSWRWIGHPIYPNCGNEEQLFFMGAQLTWSARWFKTLLELYPYKHNSARSEDWNSVEPDILFLNPRTGMVVSPYHSGVDIFSPKPEGVLNIKRRFRRWLPPPLPERKGQVTMEFLLEGTPADQAAFIEDIRQSLAAETKTSD